MIGAIDRRARSVGLAGGMDCRWIFERAEAFGKRLWRDRRSAKESFQPELGVVADERLQKRRWLNQEEPVPGKSDGACADTLRSVASALAASVVFRKARRDVTAACS